MWIINCLIVENKIWNSKCYNLQFFLHLPFVKYHKNMFSGHYLQLISMDFTEMKATTNVFSFSWQIQISFTGNFHYIHFEQIQCEGGYRATNNYKYFRMTLHWINYFLYIWFTKLIFAFYFHYMWTIIFIEKKMIL